MKSNVEITPSHKMKNRFRYDSKGQLLTAYYHDKGQTEFVYTDDGKLRFSRDTLQKATSKFTYYNYDKFNRLCERGEYNENVGNIIFQTYEEYLDNPVTGSVYSILEDKYDVGNDLADGLNISYCTEVIVNEYDVSSQLELIAKGFDTDCNQHYTSGMLSKTYSYDNTSITWYSYDEWGKLEWEARWQEGFGGKTIHYAYDFIGNLIQETYQIFDEDERFDTKYKYDDDNRLAEVHTTEYTSGNPESVKKQAEFKYYKHGPIKRMILDTDLQGIDYVYTILGRLKSINHPMLNEKINNTVVDPGNDGYNGINGDIFGMSIDYYTEDYIRSGTYINSLNSFSANDVNGRIKRVRWNTKCDLANGLGNAQYWSYDYSYTENGQLSIARFGTYTHDIFENGNKQFTVLDNDFNSPSFDININPFIKGSNKSSAKNTYHEISDFLKSGSQQSSYKYYNLFGANEVSQGYQNKSESVVFSQANQLEDFSLNSAIIQELIEENYELSDGSEYLEYQGNVGYLSSLANSVHIPSYDLNGNIETLNRYGSESTPGMDNLHMNYYQESNRLMQVQDNTTNDSNYDTDIDNQSATQNYNYSLRGEIVDNISENKYYLYNNRGLMTAVYSSANDRSQDINPISKYTYDEFGNRIRKDVFLNGSLDMSYYYVRSISGKLIARYERDYAIQTSPELIEMPIYAGRRIGIAYVSNESIVKTVYELSDYLGNIRALVSKNLQGELQLEGYTDYYPFGMKIPGRHWKNTSYNYGYQGQTAEEDDETGLLAFPLRQYDPRIGRWLTGDPMNQFASPYAAMGNNPISFVDPSGGYVPLEMAKRFRWEDEKNHRGYLNAFNEDFLRNIAGDFGFGSWAGFEKRAYERLEEAMRIASIMDELMGKGGPCEHMPEGDPDTQAEIYAMAFEIFQNGTGTGYGLSRGIIDFDEALQQATEKYESEHGDPPGNDKSASNGGVDVVSGAAITNWGKMYIISNVNENAGLTDGHAWIRLESNKGVTITMSLWGNRGEQEFWMNLEINAGYGAVSKSTTITQQQYNMILDYNSNASNIDWTPWNTCAGYSVGLWNYVTGDSLSASDYFWFTTPRSLASSINNQ